MGWVYAQNMMYQHHIRVYDHQGNFLQQISDEVRLDRLGWEGFQKAQGAPVECVFTHYGDYAWVSNYQMYGSNWKNPGCDACSGSGYDPGVVYRINTQSGQVEQAIEVGSVPKYLCASKDNQWVFVSNWVSGDVSVINTASNKTEKTIKIGRHPRGLVCSSDMKLYATVMGSNKIAVHDFNSNSTHFFEVGKGPRHLQLSPDERFLYCSLNSLGKVVKIDLEKEQVVAEVYSGSAPRSMQLSKNGQFLYVGNYSSNTLSKIDANEMKVLDKIETNEHPIGLTINPIDEAVWVACYSGSIMIFDDLKISDDHAPLALVEKDEPENLDASFEMDDLFSETSDFFESEDIAATLPVKSSPEKEIPSKKPEIEEKKPAEESLKPSQKLIVSYIVVGSFSVKDNALRLANKYPDLGMKTIPSTKSGFTYAAIPIYSGENANSKLQTAKQKVNSNAWIFRP